MGTDKNITIRAEVLASLAGMDKIRKELSRTFEEQKIEIGTDSNLSKLIKQYDSARQELDSIIGKGHITPDEVKKTKSLAKQVNQIYNNILGSLEKAGKMEIPDLRKIFPANFSTKTENGLKRIAKYYSDLSDHQIKLGKSTIANTELKNLQNTLETLKNKRTKIEIDADITQASKAIEELERKKKELENEVYEAFSPKGKKDAQGHTQAERDNLAVKNAQDQYDKMIQAEEALKKAKARALTKKDKQDLEDLQTRYNSDLSDVQIEKAQAKQIRDKLSQEIARRAGAQGKRGKSYELVEDTELQNQYRNALDNYEKLKEKESKIKKKYTEDKKAIKDRPQTELEQSREKAKTDVKAAQIALKAAKETQRTNKKDREKAEAAARQKAKDFVEGKEDNEVSPDNIQRLREYNEELERQIELQKKLKAEKEGSFKDQEDKDSSVSSQQLKIDKKKNEILKIEKDLKELAKKTSIKTVFKDLEELGVDTKDIDKTYFGLARIKDVLSNMDENAVEVIRKAIEDLGEAAKETSEKVKGMDDGLDKQDSDKLGYDQQEAEIQDLKQNILNFFSIGNSIELFKQAVRDSIETVKELDAVMTETAVVTDFTVGDMWEKLPLYAEQASKLGASIKDLYGATTLYYQQGLNSSQAMNVGIETMKMARIANMEASDATTAMTAALRGFNMEINETSATRVNDVYSELAAITAADTNQIATAMGKTASIAASANMNFETTAALLAQIIETTQEAPETAGTAMKTIIARFTEVKELFSEGMLTGEDVEGEEININKIDAALKTVGISLKDFLNGTKGMGDIFLELASKWDTLDLATQRYIATTAAGSRQQSRFLAMMSDYGRTMELVTAASNSAGASQNQYEKTLESMEAKLQKSKNAWDTFVMGIANQNALKIGTDILTKILDTINAVTQALSGGKGLSKAILSLGVAFGALKVGKTAVNEISKLLIGDSILPEGKSLQELSKGKLQSIFSGFQRGANAKSFKAIFGTDETGKFKTDLTGVATAAMLAGAALNLLGSTADAIGWEGLGEIVSSFGNKVMGLGSAAAMAAPWLKTLGVTMKQLSWGIGLAAAAFTVLPYIFDAIKSTTPEGRLEAAQKAASEAGEAAESAAKSYDSLKNALERIDDKYNAFNKMAVGTQKWKEQAKELNEEVENLIEQYPELADYFEYRNGVMSKKSGADQEIDRLLRQKEVNIQRTRQIQTQAKIEEQKRERENLENYDLQFAFQNQDAGGYAPIGFVQDVAKRVARGATEEDIIELISPYNYAMNIPYEILRSYGEILIADQNSYDSQLANNIKKQAKISGYTDSEIQEMDSNLISDIRENIYESELQNLSELKTSDKDLFAEMYGYRREGDNYYNKETGQKIEGIDDSAIRTALASARADDATIAKIAAITQQTTQDSLGARVMSEDGVNLTYENIQSIVEKVKEKAGEKATIEDLDKLDMTELGDALGIDIKAMSEELPISAEELFENIKQNIRSASDRITDQRKDLVASMNKYSKVVKQDSEHTLSDLNANILRQLEDSYGEGFRGTLENIFMALQRSGDDAIIGAGYGNFITKAMQEGMDLAELEGLSDFITNVDWGSPIEAAYQLNQEIERGSGLSQEFAKNMMSIQQGYLGAGSQMQYLIKSDDFEGIQEELNGILETSNEISASDVLDLADSYSSLNKMLKNTETSAAGVAKALQAVTKGDIKVDQLTDAVLASLEGFDSLNSMIAELQKELEDFDPGIDENFASEFIAQASEVVNENLKKGAVGNAQIDKYFDYLFTENWDEGLNPEERLAQMKELGKILEKNSEDMSNLWGTLAESAAWQTGLTKTGLGVSKDANGEITFTGYEGMSTQEQVDALVAASKVAAENGSGFEISEVMAKLMITDFKNSSRDYEYLAGTNKRDIEEISGRLVEEGITHIDQSEIDTIELLNGVTGLEAALNGLGVKITSFYEKDGSLKQTKDLVAEMAKVQGYAEDVEKYKQEKFGYYDKRYEASSGYRDQDWFNLKRIEEQLAELGLPQEAKTQIAQDVADSFFADEKNQGKTLELDFVASNGSLQTLGLKAGDSVEQAIANRELEIKNEALADSIVAAFTDNPIPVKLETNKEDLEGLTTDVQTDLMPNEQPILDLLGDSNYQATVSLIPEESNASSTENSTTTHADGIKNSPTTHDALVGEEGTELIERQDGTAYLSGMNGPEVTTIHAGDTVHTAEETKRIFGHNKGVSIPRFEAGKGAHGYGDKTGDGSGANKEEEKWENPFDKLYNLVRKIDEELRQRERIERRYEKLLENINISANKIIQVSREELSQLERERMLQEQLISGRRRQIGDYLTEKAELNKYASIAQNERGEDVLRIDWDLINSVTDKEEGEKINEYVKQLEEWFDSLVDGQDTLQDIEDTVAEIKERGEDQYFDLEEKIKEALIQSYQDQIDKLSEINNSINDTNSALLDSIQKTIDKQRQDRDNKRTEEDLAEKQRRLLYLQQDTSGANDMEILELQKEIAQGQEDYTDSLIDQKISELQKQNDEAAKQREQQITVAQAQLDHAIENGRLWEQVYSLMDEGLDPNSGLVRGTQLEQLLKAEAGFKGMSELSKMNWMEETNNMIAQALSYLELGRQLEDIGIKAGTAIEFTTKDGTTLTGIVDQDGNVKTSNGQVYNNVYQGFDGKYYARDNIQNPEEPQIEKPKPPVKQEGEREEDKQESKTGYWYTVTGSSKPYGTYAEAEAALNQIRASVAKTLKNQSVHVSLQDIENAKNKYVIQEHPYRYKKGGLADFTGPAWLDGTKSHPELVLNSKDTDNFIQLKNILGSLLNRSSQAISENNGDTIYDIDINVESIGNDYDIDQIANKIKTLINEDARYRNNNAVSLMR